MRHRIPPPMLPFPMAPVENPFKEFFDKPSTNKKMFIRALPVIAIAFIFGQVMDILFSLFNGANPLLLQKVIALMWSIIGTFFYFKHEFYKEEVKDKVDNFTRLEEENRVLVNLMDHVDKNVLQAHGIAFEVVKEKPRS